MAISEMCDYVGGSGSGVFFPSLGSIIAKDIVLERVLCDLRGYFWEQIFIFVHMGGAINYRANLYFIRNITLTLSM